MRRGIAVILAAALLTAPATAKPAEHEGVAINSMWDFMGTMSYATCLLGEYSPVPATAPEREKLIKHALKACKGAAAKSFENATMDGKKFPPMLIQLATQIAPQVRAYLLPILRALPPSSIKTLQRVRLMIAGKDGKSFEVPTETKSFEVPTENMKIPDNARFYVEIVPEGSAK